MSQPLDSFEQNIVDKVSSHGWFALSVSPLADSDDPEEWFTYTIGLPHSYGWPELICFGLPRDVAYDLLNGAIEECCDTAQPPKADMLLYKVIQKWPVKLVDGSAIPDGYFGTATWYARHMGTKAPPDRLQLLWPDPAGKFPDDPDCAADVQQDQTPSETE